MMAALREWLTAVVVVAMLLSAAEILIPEGTIRKIASFTGGLILLVTLLRPVLGADLKRLDLDFDDYGAAIEERREELEESGETRMKELIETRTAAYISDKADALGWTGTVYVTAQPGAGGVPVPWSAELTGPASQALASYMEEELGIPRGRQTWNEVER